MDEVLPAMLLPDEKELVRLPTTLDLKRDAAIRDKIKIAQKPDKGDLDGYLSSIEGPDSFGFSYDRIAARAEELGAFVRIFCVKGSPIGRDLKATQYWSKREVSLVDLQDPHCHRSKNLFCRWALRITRGKGSSFPCGRKPA